MSADVPPFIQSDDSALLFVITPPAGVRFCTEVAAGMTLGSDKDASIQLVEEGTEPRHALVRTRDDDLLEISAPAGIWSVTGERCTELALLPGTCFRIGAYNIECVEFAGSLEPRDEPIQEIDAPAQRPTRARAPASTHVPKPRPVESALRCPRCDKDISSLPATATFCAFCGQALNLAELLEGILAEEEKKTADAAAKSKPPVPPGRLEQFARFVCQQTGTEYTPPDGKNHSLMLVGYGNALFNLGWQYEFGPGKFRNVNEALRCYRKAARLGNPVARARAIARVRSGLMPTPAEPAPAETVPVETMESPASDAGNEP